MGIMSRKVLPLCGHLCICCPNLRARSRQPVKRYKKLFADMMPKTQEEPPNERKISKLTEYASKNPLRIPKIAKTLELRGYKELRSEHYGSVKTIMRTFCMLFSTCKEQMPLFAISALNMMHALIEQKNDDMRILACQTVVEFVNQQVDMTYMHNLEPFIAKFCAIAHESGPQQRRLPLRAAGLQALSAMLTFMGRISHICVELDAIVTAVLDNYEVPVETDAAKEPLHHLKEFLKGTVSLSRLSFSSLDVSRWKNPKTLTKEEAETPKVWSQICLQNFACLGKEATTIRRVIESVVNFFDERKTWVSDSGMSLAVLREMLVLIEKSGGNEHLILGALVRHLDHKNVGSDLSLKLSIVRITTLLSKHSKPKSTLSEVGVINELSRQLRKVLQLSIELPAMDSPKLELCSSLQASIKICLTELAKRVGEAAPVLEQMAVNLEKLSSSKIVARTTMHALSVLAHIVVVVTKVDLHQGFPEGLFYQLLRAMTYPDAETRLGSHSIFSILMVPPSKDDVKADGRTTYLAVISEKLAKQKHPYELLSKELEMQTVRLSGHQAWQLLSTIRGEAVLPENCPANFEAIACTFNLALLYSRPKTSSSSTCMRAFQLAFSLQTYSLDPDALQSASRRRSLFVLSTAMIAMAAVVYDLPDVLSIAKSVLSVQAEDRFLELTEDNQLRIRSGVDLRQYGNLEDEECAVSTMSQIHIPTEATIEALASLVVQKAPGDLEMNKPGVHQQLLEPFAADEVSANAQLDPRLSLPTDSLSFDEVMPSADDDNLSQTSGFGLPSLLVDAPVPPSSTEAMSVSQLLESALQAAGQVASITAPNSPLSYASLANHCEEFVARARRNMSIVLKLEANTATDAALPPSSKLLDKLPPERPSWLQAIGPRSRSLNESPVFSPPWLTPSPHPVKLPPASPFDNFLKAAGC